MNGAACEEKTPEPVTLSDERKQSVQKNEVQIPGMQQRIRYTNPLVRQNMHLIFQAESQMMRRYLTSTRWQSILRSSVLECRETRLRLISRLFRPNIKV